MIWNVVEGEQYKRFALSLDMVWHCFTPDNQFMVSVGKGETEASVWINYIGRVTSSRCDEELPFTPTVREMFGSYRKELEQSQPVKVQS